MWDPCVISHASVLSRIREFKMSAIDGEEDRPEVYFPTVVAEKIASFLNGYDLIYLSYTCKYWYEVAKTNGVWKNLIRRRFGSDSLSQRDSSTTDFKQLYFELGTSKRSVARSHYILHLNDRYLVREPEEDSLNGEVLHLMEVCWLQINDTFRSVLPGKYQLLYRMKLNGVYVNGKPIAFKANVPSDFGTSISSEWSEQRLSREELKQGSGKWFTANMGEFKVEHMCDVGVEIWGRVDYWCGGITWDTVQLKPIRDNVETVDAATPPVKDVKVKAEAKMISKKKSNDCSIA